MKTEKKSLVSNFREAFSRLSYWPRTLRLIWSTAPRWTATWAGLLIVQGLLPAATVYLTKLVIDSFVLSVNNRGDREQLKTTILLIVCTAVVMLLAEFLQGVSEWVRIAQAEVIQDYIKSLIHKKSAAVDFSLYESPEYHDRLEQATTEAASRPLALLESSGNLIQNGLTLLAMSVVLMRYGWWIPLILCLSALPAFIMVLRFDRQYHQWWQGTTGLRRWIKYFDIMLTHNQSAAEMRLLGWASNFQSKYQGLREQLRTERLKQTRKQNLAKIGASVAGLMISGSAIAWMVWKTLHGLATFGDLALFYQAFSRGQALMKTLLSSVGQLFSNSLYIGNLFEFLELKSTVVDPLHPVIPPTQLEMGIEFRNITFRYPGNTRTALENFNLTIPANKIVAIVGENGAGKSTLLKLLCRLYDPEQGSIEIDKVDLRDFAVEDLWRMQTVLFQHPLNYHGTVNDCIALGDIETPASATKIEDAARAAGIHNLVARLPEGYDTVLGKVLAEGVGLSGGEWQRMAMARAYLRCSPIILLDEPTSFLDSWGEADWFMRFRILARGRTSVIITHRFTIAMRADIIHVMQNGQIVESGSHQELLDHGGRYAMSWQTQMQSSEDNSPGAGAAPLLESQLIESAELS